MVKLKQVHPKLAPDKYRLPNKHERKIERMRKKRRERYRKQAQEIKIKILAMLATRNLGFNNIKESSGLPRQTVSKYLKEMQKDKLVFKTIENNKPVYSLMKIPDEIPFIPLAVSVLDCSLKNEPKEVFNQKLGSLVMFLINQNKIYLLESIIRQIKTFVTPVKMSYIDYKPPPTESQEWEMWKDALEGNYVEEMEFPVNEATTIKREVLVAYKFTEKWLKESVKP